MCPPAAVYSLDKKVVLCVKRSILHSYTPHAVVDIAPVSSLLLYRWLKQSNLSIKLQSPVTEMRANGLIERLGCGELARCPDGLITTEKKLCFTGCTQEI